MFEVIESLILLSDLQFRDHYCCVVSFRLEATAEEVVELGYSRGTLGWID